MPAPLCRIKLGSSAPHLSQVAAGFALLEQQGLLRVIFDGYEDFRGKGLYAHNILLEASFPDGTVLAYDVADGYEEILRKDVFDAQLDRVTRYFKRSCDYYYHLNMNNFKKVLPLGLNYAVTCKGNYMDARQAGCPYTAEDYMSHNSYPEYKGLLLTRLWRPDSVQAHILRKQHPFLSEREAEDIAAQTVADMERMNDLRVGCVRACREAFGDQFYGGLEATPYAQRQAPEEVLPPGETTKEAFLRRLKENYVCVATEGLHHSTGWKMAEYCAAGRAILTDPIRWWMPGGFRRARNYDEFSSPEDCVVKLGYLLRDPGRIHRMETANFAYYNEYVKPDAMVLRTLRQGAWELFPE